ncbi:MAG: hypothetical protein K2M68_09270 [Muribaculaceae bacterium]|nr:hypothetical protein [Muribaculaceae bacterium]
MLLSSCGDFSKGDFKTAITETVNDVLPLSEININGVWEPNDTKSYPALEFVGKSTVIVRGHGLILGPFTSGYERDEQFIRIEGDANMFNLLFEIISEDSIVGRGLTKGTWIKKK